MITTEKQVRVAAKMYECRDTLRRIDGANYGERMFPWMSLVQGIARERNIGNLRASMDLIKELEAARKADPGSVMRLAAAAVELIEREA